MLLEEFAEQLKAHAERFDLENRAIASCQQTLRNVLDEDPDETRFYLRGLEIDDLEFRFVKHSLVFGSVRSWPHILTRVEFGPPNEHWILGVEPWGYYDYETVEEGQVNDDWLWYAPMRDEEGNLTEFSRDST